MKVRGYELVSELGHGGSGSVYLARRDDGKKVALKVLKTVSRDAFARFERERRLLASFGEAEGFVPVLDGGTTEEGLPFLVMPLLEGGTLHERIARGPLPVAECVELALLLARALERAHERGVVHRDVKPANVLYGPTGPLLADLGLAKHFRHDVLGASQSSELTRHGEAVGTIGYMPPEQIQGEASPGVDVFALGATLYECLAGEPAFGESALEAAARSARGEYVPLEKVRPETPPWLAAAIARALALDPSERFPDAHAMRLAFAARTPGRPRRRAALAGLLLLLGAAAGLGLALRPRRPAPLPPRPSQPPPRPSQPPPETTASVFPRECRTFLESRRTKLGAVLEGWSGRTRAMTRSVAFSADGRSGLSASLGEVALWDMKDLGRTRTYLRSAAADGCAFSPDGKRVFAAGYGTLHVWDAETGATLLSTEVPGLVETTSFSGDLLAVGGERIQLWDLAAGRVVAAVDRRAEHVALSADGKNLLATDHDVLLALDTDTWSARTVGSAGTWLWCVSLSPDGKRALTGDVDGGVRLWDLRGESEGGSVLLGRHDATDVRMVRAVAFSPDGKRGLSASSDATLKLWDLEERRELATLSGHVDWVSACAFSPDGKTALSGGNDGAIRSWDLSTGTPLAGPTGHAGSVTAIVADAAERTAFTVGNDRTIRAWDLPSGKELGILGRSATPLADAKLFPDGKRLVAVGGLRSDFSLNGQHSGEVLVVEVASGVSTSIPDVESLVKAVAFSPDGKELLAVGDGSDRGGGLTLWSLEGEALEQTHRLPIREGYLNAVVFTAPRRAFIGVGDGTLRALDTLSGDIRRLDLKSAVSTLALSPGGSKLAAGTVAGSVAVVDPAHEGSPNMIAGPGGIVCALAFLEEDELLVATLDGGLALYDASGTELDRIDLSSSDDIAVAIRPLPERRSFLVATDRGAIVRFDRKR